MTFPYFAGKRVLYVHGFGSAGSTHTAVLLRQLLPQAEVLHPDVPLAPAEQLPFLRHYVEEHRPALIIGTSMGAMLTEKLRGVDRICVNPALHMDRTVGVTVKYGEYHILNPRQDGVQKINVTKALGKEFAAVCAQNFQGLTPQDADRVAGLFGIHDDVVNCYDEFRAHYPRAIRFDGEHRLNDHVLLHSVMPVVRFFHLRQLGVEPPAVAVRLEALRRADGSLVSGARQAFETLAETYDAYILATPDEAAEAQAEQWAERNLGVCAWHRLLLTYHAERLLADYLVTPRPDDERRFAGTVVPFGAPAFKTWDAVLAYFSRLGGQ